MQENVTGTFRVDVEKLRNGDGRDEVERNLEERRSRISIDWWRNRRDKHTPITDVLVTPSIWYPTKSFLFARSNQG
jgi:hypothetical protein